ncbi:MAG TPA: preprotein translocase subunit SecG [Rhodanobacteraceae bacterium]|nr:preprotein translocase subunit SecG [Rhodanobacteraceae bacterium]
MIFTIFSVFYVLIAAALTVLILIQRGEGASAGAGFGGGASGTVFGARGSASFLTRATAVLAGLFFILSLAMGIYLSHTGVQKPQANLGVMSGVVTPLPAASATAESAPNVHSLSNPPQNARAAHANPAAPAPQNHEVPQAAQKSGEVPQATQPAAPAKPAPKPATSGGH